jgi:uncharacterized protein (DUF1499 family)
MQAVTVPVCPVLDVLARLECNPADGERKRTVRIVVLALAAGLVVVVGLLFVVGSRWPVINVVETGGTPEYPDIIPRRYAAGKDRVFDAALHAVSRLPRWSLISNKPETGEIRAEARSKVFRFVDDVVIRVDGQGETTLVQVKSSSRIGKGDFGQNARNIRTLFEELDRQMGATEHG